MTDTRAGGPFGFHAHSGWYFRRVGDGRVEVAKWDGDKLVAGAEFDRGTWASIVASVSELGEDSVTFAVARAFHDGQPLAVPSLAALADEGVSTPSGDAA